MQNCEILGWYGALVLVFCGAMIVVPYWRGKADLISAWNFLLLGIAIFVGLQCIEAATSPVRFHCFESFSPTKSEVWFYLGATNIFLAVLMLVRSYDPVSKAIVGRLFNNWPPNSTTVNFVVVVICLVL